MYRKILVLSLILFLILNNPALVVKAQTEYPIYIVQQGDTLNTIAQKFGIKVDELVRLNNISNPNLLSVGAELKIPGLEGIKGIINLETISVGETLKSLSLKYQQTPETILKLNKITSPARLFAGASLIIPKNQRTSPNLSRLSLRGKQSLLEASTASGTNPWSILLENNLTTGMDALPGDQFYYPGKEGEKITGTGISPLLNKFEIVPLPLTQGKTTVIKIESSHFVSFSATLVDKKVSFWKTGEDQFVGLQGIHAQSQPGLVQMTLTGTLADGSIFSFEQSVLLQSGGFGPTENITGVDEKTLDPVIINDEEALIKSIVSQISPVKFWNGKFRTPSHFPDAITSYFGRSRTYNGGAYRSYHAGLDYGYGNNLPIYAPAPGKIVFTGLTKVRGNATIIDHGWGVFSGFWHQSQINVNVGDMVEAGQPIGHVGNTGRSTGSHLHWELWVNENQVDPLDWLNKSYP